MVDALVLYPRGKYNEGLQVGLKPYDLDSTADGQGKDEAQEQLVVIDPEKEAGCGPVSRMEQGCEVHTSAYDSPSLELMFSATNFLLRRCTRPFTFKVVSAIKQSWIEPGGGEAWL
jgi:hypothetical protein